MSFGTDEGEVLIPTVVNGRVVSDEQAIAEYRRTGRHLGIFRTPEEATAYARRLHDQQEQQYVRRPHASALDAATLTGESGGRRFDRSGSLLRGPVTRSGEQAMGEWQVMPSTARDPGFGIRPWNGSDLDDLARVGREYRATMERRYGGDVMKMWAAYNWGPGNLDNALRRHGENWLQHAPQETRDYINRNLRSLRRRS